MLNIYHKEEWEQKNIQDNICNIMKRGTSQPRTSLVFPAYRTSTEPEPELNLTLLDIDKEVRYVMAETKKNEASGEGKKVFWGEIFMYDCDGYLRNFHEFFFALQLRDYDSFKVTIAHGKGNHGTFT